MRVEVHLDSTPQESCAILHISKLSPTIQSAIELLKQDSATVLAAQAEGKTFLLSPDSVEIIRTEGREIALYTTNAKRFVVNRTLYELEQLMGSSFIRISKSALVNFFSIDHVQASFNGTMEIVMHSGIEEVITRSYKQQFKQRLEGNL